MTDREQDIWDVKCLDAYKCSEPTNKPSAAIARMLELRRQRFEQTKADFLGEVEFVYKEVEENIARFLKELKLYLEGIASRIKYFIDTVTINYNDILQLHETIFVYAKEKASEIFSVRRDGIDFYCRQLMDVESDRSERIKLIFSKYFTKYSQIAHQLPGEVQEYFENEMMYYNEMILNNIRSYADLHLHLVLSGDKYFLQLTNVVNFLECRWNAAKVAAESEGALLYVSRGKPSFASDGSSRDFQYIALQISLSCIHPKEPGYFRALAAKYTDTTVIRDNERSWPDQLTLTIMHLDDCERKIVNLFIGAVEELLAAANTDLRKLQLAFLEDDLIVCTNIARLEVIVTAVIQCLQNRQGRMSEEEKHHFNDTKTRMQYMIVELHQFLKGSADIWRRHFWRMRVSERFINAALHKQVSVISVQMQGVETKVNLELESLRQELTKLKLSKAVEKVTKTLDTVTDLLQSSVSSEISIIKSMMLLATADVTTLNEDLEELHGKHSRKSLDVNLIDSQTNITVLEDKDRHATGFSKKLYTCDMRLAAVDNWTIGIWETMQNYASSCLEDATSGTQQWIDTMIKQARNRVQLRIQKHEYRYQRVHLEIHNLRLAEITQHSESMKSYNLEVEDHVNKMKDGFNSLIETHAKDMNQLEANYKKTEDLALSSANAGNMAFHKTKLFAEIDEFPISFKSAVTKYQEECSQKIIGLRKSTTYFMESVRMFFEGGNFSAKEATGYISMLQEVDKSIVKQQGVIKKLISSQESLSLKKDKARTDVMKARLIHIYDDLLFGGKVVRELEKLQAMIKKEVCVMKSNSKPLHQQTSAIENIISRDADNFCTPAMTEKWDDLIGLLKATYSYLLLTEDPTDAQKEVEQIRTPKGETSQPSDKTNQQQVDEPEILSGSKHSDSFITRVCTAIKDKLDVIQKIAENFYAKKGSRRIVRQDMIQESYAGFMEEIMMKMRYYEDQCREVWLDQAKEHLKLTTKVQEMAKDYARLLLEEFQTCRVNQLTEMKSDFKKELNVWSNDHLDRRSEMLRRLLPTHGHPGNSKLLTDLNDEVLSSFEQHTFQGLQTFASYKESLDEVYDTYQPQLDEIVEHFTNIGTQVFAPELTSLLTKQIDRASRDLIKVDATKETEMSTSNDLNTREDGNATKDDDMIQIVTEPSSTERLRIQDETLQAEEKEVEQSPSGTDKETAPSGKQRVLSECGQLKTMQPLLMIGKETDQLLKVYRSHYDLCCHLLNKEAIKYKNESKEWIKNWKSSVKAVKGLYPIPFGSL